MRKIKAAGAASDSILLAFVRVVTMLVAILQTKILSVGLSLADYGTYSQAHVISAIFTSMTILGLGDAINYFYNGTSGEGSAEKRIRYANTIVAIEIIFGAIVGVGLLLGQGLVVAYFSNEAVRKLLWVVALLPMLNNLLVLNQVLFVSIGKAKVIAVRNLIVSVLKVIIFYAATSIFKNLVVIYIALVGLELAQLILFQVVLRKEGVAINPFKADFSLLKTIMKYALPMGVFALTNTLLRDVDKLVIGYVADAETLAIYTNCSKVLPFDIIASSFATVLIPYIMRYISSKSYGDATRLFKSYLKVGYYSVWLLGMAIICVSETAICFLYAEKYLPGKAIFAVYIIDSLVRFASMHLIITADGQSKLLMKYSLISLAANTVLDIALYYLMGTIGPAVATTIVTVGYTVAVLHKSIRILNISWKEAFDWCDVLIFILQLLITGAAMMFMDRGLQALGLHKYISMIISGCVYAGINLVLMRKKIKEVLKVLNSLKLER